jgi:hypothetical protein
LPADALFSIIRAAENTAFMRAELKNLMPLDLRSLVCVVL